MRLLVTGGPCGRILLADDDELSVQFITELLTFHGFEVFAANNGKDILTEFPKVHPDLGLVDVQIPFINGFEACRRLKSDPDRGWWDPEMFRCLPGMRREGQLAPSSPVSGMN